MLGRQITKDIFSAVKRATAHLKDVGQGGQSGGGGVISSEFKQVVSEKADKSLVEEVILAKANKIDTQVAMDWIELLNRQIKQVIVLMTEVLRFEAQKNSI